MQVFYVSTILIPNPVVFMWCPFSAASYKTWNNIPVLCSKYMVLKCPEIKNIGWKFDL